MTAQAIATDYRARRYLVRTALSRWLATLPASGYAQHDTTCPACDVALRMERGDDSAFAMHSASIMSWDDLSATSVNKCCDVRIMLI